MPTDPATPTILRPADLRQSGPTAFKLEPDAADRAGLASSLELSGLRKLRFVGQLAPKGRSGWLLTADLGATVVQPCIVTLEPVTTRIDQPVTRFYVPPDRLADQEPGAETEMPEDDSLEPLGDVIDLTAVMAEALALALPVYPRKPDAAFGDAQFAEDGVTPLEDADLRPFAGLKGLRDKLSQDDDDAG